MKKRILSVILCVCMMLTLIPTIAFASDDGTSGTEKSNTVNVMEAPYSAKGDGATDDREAIQSAIDYVHNAGGGTVTLPAGKTFLSGNIILKSNVTLHFEDGAKIKQNTNQNAYVKAVGNTYESYLPLYGRNMENVEYKYGHTWYHNYPFIYAGEGTENVKITGNGTIEMTKGSKSNGDDTICVCPVGFYRVKNFEISDITITKYCTYAIMPYTCNDGLIKNVKINNPEFGSGDGISLMNSQNIRITGCELTTNDDGIYIFSSYNDPRGGTWWSSDNPQPSKNIEIDHNKGTVTWTDTKAIGLILWGAGCPDQSLVEVSNVYIHDNEFNTMGIWDNHPYDDATNTVPMKNIRFENNTIGTVQSNFYTIPMSDVYGYDCMTEMRNGDFEKTGEAYWVLDGEEGSAGAANDSVGQEGTYYGFINNLDKGDAKIYQGIKLEKGTTYEFTANVQTSGATCQMFVRDQKTGTLIESKEFSNTNWSEETMTFDVPETGNYQIGIERGNATNGWARIDSAEINVGTANTQREQTIFTTQTPTDFDPNKSGSYDLGTLFSAQKAGWITKVRIYTHESESGKYAVRIWDHEKQEVIAGPYEWNITAGTTGWQEFELPEPLHIEAGKKYVVSVPNGNKQYYARGKSAPNDFSTPILNGDLITYTTSGLFSTSIGSMPSRNNKTMSYFRDVVFVPEQTIFTTQVPTDYDTELKNNYDLGTRFQSKMSGKITKVRIYTHENESGTHVVRIWDYEKQEVIAGPYNWDVTAGTTGWQEFELPEALSIEAGKDYMVSVTNGNKSYYARGKNPSNNFEAPILNGDLVTYVGSSYYTTSVGSMPNKSNRNMNYFRDIVFVPGSLDRSALQSEVDANKNRQQGSYTDNTWKTFQDALTEAEKLLQKNSNATTQVEVDEMTKTLQNAASGLALAKTVTDPVIELSESKYVYDGKEKTPDVVVKDGDTVIPASEYEVKFSNHLNVGTATVAIVDKEGGSYNVSGTKTFSISAAPVTIKAENKEANTGDKKPELTYTISGLLNDDKLVKEPTLSCDTDMEKAGEFDIVVSGADAGENYTITYEKGTLYVTEKSISPDGGSTDSGSTDSGSTDSGSTDSGSTDSGSTDSGSTDNGSSSSTSSDGSSSNSTSNNSSATVSTSNVATGDTSSVGLWGVFVLIALGGILVILRRRNKYAEMK